MMSFILWAFSVQVFAADVETEYRTEIDAYKNAQPADKADALIELLIGILDNYPADAIAYVDGATATIARATIDQQMQITGMTCWSYLSLSQFEAAKEKCNELLKNAIDAGKRNPQAQAYNTLGVIATDEGNDTLALKLFNQSIAIAEYPGVRSAAHNNAGKLLKDRGAYEQAFEHYSLALKESQDPSLSADASCYYASATHFEISDINKRLGDLTSAIRYTKLALACTEITREVSSRVAAFKTLTSLYLNLDDIAEAEKWSKQAEILAESREKTLVGMASHARAAVLDRQENIEQALAMAKITYENTVGQPLSLFRLDAAILLSKLLSKSGQHKTALATLDDVETEARALSRNDMLERILEVQPPILKADGQLDAAYKAQQEFIELTRANLKLSTLRRMTLLQSQLDLQQQETATEQAQLLQRAAEEQASQATFTRNMALVGAVLLLIIGYLAVTRRFQAQQATHAEATKHKLENELREQSEVLRKKASENLALETQMLHKQKLEAVGQLTGGIAHDFNNLMVVVMGAIELVRDSSRSQLDDFDSQLLLDASEAVSSGTDITRQLLAYARQQPLDPAPTEITALLESTSAMLGHALGDRISLVRTKIEEKIWCEIDQAQLVTALLNLTINARDATSGSGEVTLSCTKETIDASHPKLTQGDYCKLEIEDSGAGIAPEELERVVEPFFTTKELGNGHGLGLSMVYGFVKQSNGEFEIQSQLGKGTKVTIWLPLCKEPADKTVSDVASIKNPASRDARTILVVEDQAEVLVMAEMILVDLGYYVQTANNGAEAQQMIADGFRPAAVFSDVSMPGKLDGIQLARWLKTFAPQIPIVLTSGYPQEQISQSGSAFLPKPYRSNQLGAVLEKVMLEQSHNV